MLAIPDFAGLPIFEGSMNELIKGVFLVFSNVKNVRLIQTGQIEVSLRHVNLEFKAHKILCVKRLLCLFVVKCQGMKFPDNSSQQYGNELTQLGDVHSVWCGTSNCSLWFWGPSNCKR